MRIKEFEQFTDADSMKAIFQQRLQRFWLKQSVITYCEVLCTRYRVYSDRNSRGKSSLSATYRLKINDNLRERVQVFYARCYLEGRSEYKFQNIHKITPTTSESNDILIHLPDLDTILWTFPNDPRLPQLRLLADAKKAKNYLPYEQLPKDLSSSKKLHKLTVELIRYHPEHRCTLKYCLQWGPTNAPKTLTLFGKTYRDDRGENVHRYMEQSWRKSAEPQDVLLIARPLGYNETVKTVWQEGLSGNWLVDYVDETNYRDLVESIANALAKLHQSGVSSLIKTGLDDHLSAIRAKIDELVQTLPHLKKPLFTTIRNLEDQMSNFGPIPLKPIHGAFRMSQLLERAGKIAVFDFDGFAIGDPLQDLADFVVDSHFRGFDPALLNLIVRHLYHSYRLQVPWEVPPERLNWHIQVQLINNASRCYRKQKAGFMDIVEYSVAQAKQGCIRNMESMARH